ncbi:MAG: hypothetical protein EOP85_02040 [Verrucomicrobiaceae bacterium]|nr:MAG: hypothetical protein EOP85_02040 [Verrucomicrobiaceae bacterium]
MNYAKRMGIPYLVHQDEGHPFEHRLPAILAHPSDVTLYLEWDVRVADDAPDVFPLPDDADIVLTPHTDLPHGEWLRQRVEGLEMPWHIIGVMLGRRSAFEKIHDHFPGCRAAAATLPTEAARYEGAILLAIQRAGLRVADLPSGLHKFARRHHRAAFLHFEGDTKARLRGKKPVMTCGWTE